MDFRRKKGMKMFIIKEDMLPQTRDMSYSNSDEMYSQIHPTYTATLKPKV